MLQISNDQLAVFAAAATSDFEERMRVHLNDVFPELCRPLGDAGLRALIREGVARAADHALVLEYDVCLYLHLTLVLGREFERDPAQHGVAYHLGEPALTPSQRVSAAYDAAVDRHAQEP